MIGVIFNYIGDIELVKAEFPKIPFISVPEMTAGSFLIPLNTPEDFIPLGDFMTANGVLEVVAGWNKDGDKDAFKEVSKMYTTTKYKKFLLDRWNYDEQGNKTTKIPKEAWQVNKIMGWADRDLTL